MLEKAVVFWLNFVEYGAFTVVFMANTVVLGCQYGGILGNYRGNVGKYKDILCKYSVIWGQIQW